MSEGKIMIVENDKDLRKSIRSSLEGEPFHVVEARNGKDAVRKLRDGDNLLSVGLILCDIDMPPVEEMECIQYLRNEAPGIPIVVVTGKDDTLEAVKLLNRGVKDYLVKPLSRDRLRRTVEQFVTGEKEFLF